MAVELIMEKHTMRAVITKNNRTNALAVEGVREKRSVHVKGLEQ